MAKPRQSSSRSKSTSTGRRSRNTYTTKSGQTIKLNQNMSQKMKGFKDTWKTHKAARLAGMPKTHMKRFLYRMKPSNLYHYWFSREGAIMALKVFGIGVVVLFILLVGAFAYLRKDLPQINNIYGQNLGGSITYYDSTGKTVLWQDYSAVKRVPVAGADISPFMKNATVSIEDKNFYHEGAFDVKAILRSAYHDTTSSGSALQGGSTITQQLVKLNENWTNNRTIIRKIKEVVLASELEREYSKPDILAAYLNIAPYGGVDYGVQTAAQDYFHINASQLNLAQAAFLAAIPQSPDYYSPYSPNFNSQALAGRSEYILNEMQKQGYITGAQKKVALAENVVAEVKPQQSKYSGIQSPYFVLAAKNQLQQQFGTSTVNRGGWKVITTENITQQQEAESLVAKNLPNVKHYAGDEEAMVVENVPTGQVTALVGGVDFNNPSYGQINYATIPVNPGSSYKLYDYTSLINYNNNAGAGSVLYDTQGPLPGYPCTDKTLPAPKGTGNCLEDYDFKYPGPLTLRYALAGSRNVPAVKAMLITGESKVINLSEQMGLKSGYNCFYDAALTKKAPCYASAAIGDGAYLRLDEHVNGFATNARLGNYIPQTYILKITDANNKNVFTWTQPKPQQVVKPDASYIVDNMLSDPNASYLPASYKFQHTNGWDFAVKTGTTNDNYDGLMMSFSTQYAVGTWVGYHTRQVALVAGGMEYLTEPLARGMMTYLHKDLKPNNWVAPADIKTDPAYVVTGHVGVGSVEPSPSKDIYPGWYNPPSLSGKTATIDIVSGNLATSCTPTLAKKGAGATANSNIFSIDTFVNKPSTVSTFNTAQNDTLHQCGDQLPTISLQSANITCNGTTCSAGVNVAQGTHPLSSDKYPIQINVLIDGKSVAGTCSFTPDINGSSPASAATGQCTFPYNLGSQHTIQLQVVDSVLYSANTASVIINTPSMTSPTTTGSNPTISWTGGSGPYTVQANGTTYCTTTSQSCSGSNLGAPGQYNIQIIDNSDQDSSPVTQITVSGP